MKIIPDNAQALGTRERQEDSFAFSNFDNPEFIKEKGYLAIVADGMGGLFYGKEASEIAVQSFLESYQSYTSFESIIDLLHLSLQDANKMVRNMAVEQDKVDQTGTTLAAATIIEGSLYWISVGDSRIYLYRNGELIQLNEDHQYSKLLYEEVMKENITVEEANSHPQRNALISFLGLPSLPEIDFNVKEMPLENGDIVLLCSDGLHGFMTDEEIAAILKENNPSPAQPLIDFTLQKKHPYQDNITVATLTFVKEEAPPSPAPELPVEDTKQKKVSLTIILSILFFFIIGAGIYFGIKGFEFENGRPSSNYEELIVHETEPKEGDIS